MVSAPAKALIHSSVSDQNWKNCQLLRRRMAGFSAAVDTPLARGTQDEGFIPKAPGTDSLGLPFVAGF
jgi:hypothetical protein